MMMVMVRVIRMMDGLARTRRIVGTSLSERSGCGRPGNSLLLNREVEVEVVVGDDRWACCHNNEEEDEVRHKQREEEGLKKTRQAERREEEEQDERRKTKAERRKKKDESRGGRWETRSI